MQPEDPKTPTTPSAGKGNDPYGEDEAAEESDTQN